MTDNIEIRTATVILFSRYEAMINDFLLTKKGKEELKMEGDQEQEYTLSHALFMCKKSLENQKHWPVDKLSRWLGYVQCLICIKGLSTTLEERNYSRPLFHNAYRKNGIDIPQTVENPILSKNKVYKS